MLLSAFGMPPPRISRRSRGARSACLAIRRADPVLLIGCDFICGIIARAGVRQTVPIRVLTRSFSSAVTQEDEPDLCVGDVSDSGGGISVGDPAGTFSNELRSLPTLEACRHQQGLALICAGIWRTWESTVASPKPRSLRV